MAAGKDGTLPIDFSHCDADADECDITFYRVVTDKPQFELMSKCFFQFEPSDSGSDSFCDDRTEQCVIMKKP
jgi:hypothetical protein